MAISRKLLAHEDNETVQWLKVDHASRYIQMHSSDWQFLFNPESTLSASEQIIKIAAKFDDNTFNNIRMSAYLYDQQNATIGNAATCVFKVYKVSGADWVETLLATVNGTQLSNNYFYVAPDLNTLGNLDYQGGDTIMIEATIIRLTTTYRDRIYVNHLGIYDNITRLRGDVEFLEVTKMDE
jgi:hypothetical protein